MGDDCSVPDAGPGEGGERREFGVRLGEGGHGTQGQGGHAVLTGQGDEIRRGGAGQKGARFLIKKRTAGFLDSCPAMRYNSDRKGTVTSGLASF